MIISGSTINMASSRKYAKTSYTKQSVLLAKKETGKLGNGENDKISLSQKSMDLSEKLRELDKERVQNMVQSFQAAKSTGFSYSASKEDTILQTLRKLLESLRMAKKGKYSKLDIASPEKQKDNGIGNLVDSIRNNPLFGQQGGGNTIAYLQKTEGFHYMEESEYTSFSTTGTVKTADGREINFNVELEMSRKYMEMNAFENTEIVMMRDPLVINVGKNVASVSDQKFRFDIDADGEMDEISFLNRGSGFLALDKNGDGIINDGSELFGTKSGDGFWDLAAYDEDGNGWIDEADSIFKDLKVWMKDENGKDELIGLGKAGIGAIYLGNASTKFSLNQQQNNQTNAEIRKTGIYLKESGEVGTVQHVDFAI